MGWWLLRLSAKILALLQLSVNFFQLRLTKKLKINFFCFKELNINKPVFSIFKAKSRSSNCCLSTMCFTKSDVSACSFRLVFRGHDLLKITNINPQQEARFSPWKKLGSSRERRKWSPGLCQQVKLNVRTESK